MNVIERKPMAIVNHKNIRVEIHSADDVDSIFFEGTITDPCTDNDVDTAKQIAVDIAQGHGYFGAIAEKSFISKMGEKRPFFESFQKKTLFTVQWEHAFLAGDLGCFSEFIEQFFTPTIYQNNPFYVKEKQVDTDDYAPARELYANENMRTPTGVKSDYVIIWSMDVYAMTPQEAANHVALTWMRPDQKRVQLAVTSPYLKNAVMV